MQRDHMVRSEFLSRKVQIVVVGAGGNGSAMLAALATLNYAIGELGHPGLEVTAIDGDRGHAKIRPIRYHKPASYVEVCRHASWL